MTDRLSEIKARVEAAGGFNALLPSADIAWLIAEVETERKISAGWREAEAALRAERDAARRERDFVLGERDAALSDFIAESNAHSVDRARGDALAAALDEMSELHRLAQQGEFLKSEQLDALAARVEAATKALNRSYKGIYGALNIVDAMVEAKDAALRALAPESPEPPRKNRSAVMIQGADGSYEPAKIEGRDDA